MPACHTGAAEPAPSQPEGRVTLDAVEDQIIDLSGYPKRHNSKAASPFRYPGGKGFLTSFLQEQISQRFPSSRASYAEPYCGGAGAALNLLVDDLVDHLYLNDADYRIYSAWHAMLFETDRFLEEIEEVSVDLATWQACLAKLHEKPDELYDFDSGFAAFFINRTSRSGVILGSGPIGGYDQEGTWKIDARFNKPSLIEKIAQLGQLRERVSPSCLDGMQFCRSLEDRDLLDDTFLFVDPPYVQAGGRLYWDGMNLPKHDALAEWLLSGVAKHWLLTYDDHPIVRENYRTIQAHKIAVRYSLGRRRLEKELLYQSPIAA